MCSALLCLIRPSWHRLCVSIRARDDLLFLFFMVVCFWKAVGSGAFLTHETRNFKSHQPSVLPSRRPLFVNVIRRLMLGRVFWCLFSVCVVWLFVLAGRTQHSDFYQLQLLIQAIEVEMKGSVSHDVGLLKACLDSFQGVSASCVYILYLVM